jgi:hypothetical protein
LLLIGIVVTFAVTAFSTTMDDDSAATNVGSGPLDGLDFVGKLCPDGRPDLDDELQFNDGQFWSATCTSCGFPPGPY